MDLKAAFLICPIGEEGSPEREWSNDIYMELVIPVCKEFGIRVERANDDDRPGEIPARIMEHLDRDGLVIADLTFRNPNVRSEEHTSELQSLMRISYAVFCLQKKKQ